MAISNNSDYLKELLDKILGIIFEVVAENKTEHNQETQKLGKYILMESKTL